MDKSSLSKIVRSYIEQAKEGVSGSYHGPKQTFSINQPKKPPSQAKPKSSAAVDRGPLVRKPKPPGPGESHTLQLPGSKNVSLNASHMKASRSTTPTKNIPKKQQGEEGKAGKPEDFLEKASSDENRLSDRRCTVDNDDIQYMHTVGGGEPADQTAASKHKSSRVHAVVGASKQMLSNSSSFKEKDKVFGQTVNFSQEKFIAKRKVLLGSSNNTNNGSFTFKSGISTSNSKLASKLKPPAAEGKEPKKYLQPSEVPELDQLMKASTQDDFLMQHLLGKGAYASTYFGVHTGTKVAVAMKVYVYNEKNTLKNSIESEVSILSKLSHPNVVKLYHAFEVPNKSILVLE